MIYAICYVLLREKIGVVALVLIYVTLFGIWVLSLMPTRCDYITQRGGHCTRSVRGKLNGCASRARLKRDALFGAIGRRNPGTRFRVLWGDGSSQVGWRITSATPPIPAPGRPNPATGGAGSSPRYNRWMMGFTAISALAAVVTILLPK
jgi:hypothetical protein